MEASEIDIQWSISHRILFFWLPLLPCWLLQSLVMSKHELNGKNLPKLPNCFQNGTIDLFSLKSCKL